MAERNWAEHDRRIQDHPTLEDCWRTGRTHAAYGWACTPWGHWSSLQKEAYRRGFKSFQLQSMSKEKDA